MKGRVPVEIYQPKETSINKIVSLIGGKKIFIPEIPGETKRSCANISLISKDTNWKPKIGAHKSLLNLLNTLVIF